MQLRWLEQTEEQVPTGNAWLTQGERAHLAALHMPKRRADWRLGRWSRRARNPGRGIGRAGSVPPARGGSVHDIDQPS